MRTIRGARWLLGAGLVALWLAPARAQDPSAEELQRELKAMKAQLQQLQEKMEKQQELIDKLSKQKGAAPAATPAVAAAVPTPQEEKLKQEITEQVERDIQPEPDRGQQDVSVAVQPGDRADHRHRRARTRSTSGGNFEFRSAELGLSANDRPVRARLRDHQRHADEDRGRGGRHRHHLAALQPDAQGRPLLRRLRPPVEVPRPRPAVRQPADRARRLRRRRVAGRRRRAQLAGAAEPVPDAHAGAYNKIGAENPRVDNVVPRDPSASSPTWPAGDVLQPERLEQHRPRRHLRLHPEGRQLQRRRRRSLLAQRQAAPPGRLRADLPLHPAQPGELPRPRLGHRGPLNHETWNVGPTTRRPTSKSEDAVGLYSYAEPRLTRRYYPGFLFD